MTDIFYILFGLVLLFFGGEALLRGSVSLARSYNISKLLISAVIIGFGTSMPELTVSVGAALKDSPDIALGNVIGSNIANILLIVGISALICPILITDKAIRRDIFAMLFSGIMLAALMWFDALNFVSGVLLLLGLAVYIYRSFSEDRKRQNKIHEHMEEDSDPQKPYKPAVAVLISVCGLAALVGGASLLVDGAVSIARGYGISEAIIGLTLVAVGTSLPELATAIIASVKKHGDVVLGNILGSNIFNILAILSITSMVQPIPVSPHMMNTDIWVMLAVSLLISILLMKQIQIGRQIAALMLVSYVSYSAWLYIQT